MRPRRSTPMRAGDLVVEAGDDVLADGQVARTGSPRGRRTTNAVPRRAVDRVARRRRRRPRPVVRSKPATARTSSRAPEPSTPASGDDRRPRAPRGRRRGSAPPRCAEAVQPQRRRAGVLGRRPRPRARAPRRRRPPACARWRRPSARRPRAPSRSGRRGSPPRDRSARPARSGGGRRGSRCGRRPPARACGGRGRRDSSSVSAEFGSSKSTTRASWASARAISVRCWTASGCGAELARRRRRGWRGRASSSRSRSSSAVLQPARALAPDDDVLARPSGSGRAAAPGARPPRGGRPATATTSRRRSGCAPSSPGTSAASTLIIVLLPAPFGPAMPRICPASAVEVEAVERDGVAVALDEAADLDAGGRRSVRLHVRPASRCARFVYRSSTTARIVTVPSSVC